MRDRRWELCSPCEIFLHAPPFAVRVFGGAWVIFGIVWVVRAGH